MVQCGGLCCRGATDKLQTVPLRYMGGDRRKRRSPYTSWRYDSTRALLKRHPLYDNDYADEVAKQAYRAAAALFDAT